MKIQFNPTRDESVDGVCCQVRYASLFETAEFKRLIHLKPYERITAVDIKPDYMQVQIESVAR